MTLDFGALPPEVNSARIYSGPGSAPLVEAARAWQRLANELNATADSYSTVTSGLAGQEWQGASALSMAAAVAPYVAWMQGTAAQAEQAAAQALAAAGAYESAFAMTVPPTAISANRSTMISLIQANIFGQNTPAIAATEGHYSEMWAQDIVAMESYAGNSAAASALTPFAPPPLTTSEAGLASQAAVADIAPTAAPAAAATTPAPAASIPTPIPGVAIPVPGLQDLDLLVAASLAVAGGSLIVALGEFGERLRHDEISETEIEQELEQGAGEPASSDPILDSAFTSQPGSRAAVAAVVGHSTPIGGLSAPQSWVLPPAVRQVAAMFPGTTPMFMGDGSDSGYMGMMGAGMAATGLAGLATRGGSSSPTPPAAAPAASGGASAAAAKPAANTPAVPAAAAGAGIPGLPPGLPPGVVANLAATLAAIPGATIIVVPPADKQ